jgi:hypothetical protein
MCAFTLLALRCVNSFYTKRIKVVEKINQIEEGRFFFTVEGYGRGGGLG